MIAFLTALPAILGALAGMLPAFFQWLTLKENNAHQLAMAQEQREAAKEGIALQVDLEGARADTRQADAVYGYGGGASGIKWVDAVAVLVRPYITIVFFHLWFLMEISLFIYAVNSNYDAGQMVKLLWPPETQALFAAIMGFWFGNRMLLRGQPQMSAYTAVTTTKGTQS